MTENELSKIVLNLGLKVHKALGAGLLESTYEEALNDLHLAQILTYLKLSNCKLGLLLNFNTVLFKNGIKRIANNL